MNTRNSPNWIEVLGALDDSVGHIRIAEHDCGSQNGRRAIGTHLPDPGIPLLSCAGRSVVYGVVKGAEPVAPETILDEERLRQFSTVRDVLEVRSPLTCESSDGVCATCYGHEPKSLEAASVGQTVGQQALDWLHNPRKAPFRTAASFHMGRVEQPILADRGGVLRFGDLPPGLKLEVVSNRFQGEGLCLAVYDLEGTGEELCLRIDGADFEYRFGNEDRIIVADGQDVEPGAPIGYERPPGAQGPYLANLDGLAKLLDGQLPLPRAVVSPFDGTVEIESDDGGHPKLIVAQTDDQELRAVVLENLQDKSELRVDHGDAVTAGQELTRGWPDVQALLDVAGRNHTLAEFFSWIRFAHRCRRMLVPLRDLELITSWMFRWMRVAEPGSLDWAPGTIVSRQEFVTTNEAAVNRGDIPARGHPQFLGAREMARVWPR